MSWGWVRVERLGGNDSLLAAVVCRVGYFRFGRREGEGGVNGREGKKKKGGGVELVIGS